MHAVNEVLLGLSSSVCDGGESDSNQSFDSKTIAKFETEVTGRKLGLGEEAG